MPVGLIRLLTGHSLLWMESQDGDGLVCVTEGYVDCSRMCKSTVESFGEVVVGRTAGLGRKDDLDLDLDLLPQMDDHKDDDDDDDGYAAELWKWSSSVAIYGGGEDFLSFLSCWC